MYCVTAKSLTSDMFPCTVDVRQGVRFVTFLFALNDFDVFLSTNDVILSYQPESKCKTFWYNYMQII